MTAQHPLERATEQIDAAVGQAGGQQRDQLAVVGSGVAEGKLDRVARDPRAVVELAIEPLERLAEGAG